MISSLACVDASAPLLSCRAVYVVFGKQCKAAGAQILFFLSPMARVEASCLSPESNLL